MNAKMEWLLGECRAHADNTHQQCKKIKHKDAQTNAHKQRRNK